MELLQEELKDAIESYQDLLFVRENFSFFSPWNWYSFIDFLKILIDFFSDNKWADILMLCKEYYDLVTGYLDSHIAACGCVLYNDSNEGAHH